MLSITKYLVSLTYSKIEALILKISDFNKKFEILAAKAELKSELDKIVKFHSFDSSYVRLKIHFEDDGIKNYLFQLVYRCFKKICNTNHFLAWKSKGSPDEKITCPATYDNSLAPSLKYIRPRIKFDGQFLKQDKVAFNHKNEPNIYNACEINLWPFKNSAVFRKEILCLELLSKYTCFYK